jgi:hypothetical protein
LLIGILSIVVYLSIRPPPKLQAKPPAIIRDKSPATSPASPVYSELIGHNVTVDFGDYHIEGVVINVTPSSVIVESTEGEIKNRIDKRPISNPAYEAGSRGAYSAYANYVNSANSPKNSIKHTYYCNVNKFLKIEDRGKAN